MSPKIILLLTLSLTGCSLSRGHRNPYAAQGSHVRVYEMEEKWSPEGNCKQIDYIKVLGHELTKGEEGYQDALFHLRMRASELGGTVAKIRDVAEDFLFAYIFFCSPDYSK